MAAFVLDAAATVLCQHGGQASPVSATPRVRLSGQPAVTLSSTFVVAGCPLTPPALPCVTASWVSAAVRLRSGGQPLILNNSQAVCVPTGTGLQVVIQQIRVKGS